MTQPVSVAAGGDAIAAGSPPPAAGRTGTRSSETAPGEVTTVSSGFDGDGQMCGKSAQATQSRTLEPAGSSKAAAPSCTVIIRGGAPASLPASLPAGGTRSQPEGR